LRSTVISAGRPDSKRAHDVRVVDPKVRVAVEDEELVPEKGQRSSNGTCRSGGLRPVVDVRDLEAEVASVADRRLDLLAEVADGKDDPPRSVRVQELELVLDKRPSSHR
jgi:hypothetical protein